MSYLLDRKIKRKKLSYGALFFVIAIVLFYFRLGVFNNFSYVGHKIFHPVLVVGNNVGEKWKNIESFFVSKNSLYQENADLKSELNQNRGLMSNYNSILSENISLKEILGRKDETHSNDSSGGETTMVLAAILAKPNQSLYDTLVVDAGANQGIETGDRVFGLGNVPIGRISATYPNSSKVVLFSSAGEKMQGIVSIGDNLENKKNQDIFMEVIGRGGGNFEMIMPRDFKLMKGDQVVLPGITPYVLGVVETIISDPRDPFIKALLVSPVNIQELKFVEVEM